jgi:hypothetical protein
MKLQAPQIVQFAYPWGIGSGTCTHTTESIRLKGSSGATYTVHQGQLVEDQNGKPLYSKDQPIVEKRGQKECSHIPSTQYGREVGSTFEEPCADEFERKLNLSTEDAADDEGNI